MKLRYLLAVVFAATAQAQSADSSGVPNLTALVARPTSELAGVVDRFSTDLASVSRRYDATDSPAQRARMREFYSTWLKRVGEIDFDVERQAVFRRKEFGERDALVNVHRFQHLETMARVRLFDYSGSIDCVRESGRRSIEESHSK